MTTSLIQDLSQSDLSSVDLSIFFEGETVHKEELVVLAEGTQKSLLSSPSPPIAPPIIEDSSFKIEEQNLVQTTNSSTERKADQENKTNTSFENEGSKSDDEIDVVKETYQFDVRFKETEE
jgi:vacuolar-type H+-ATPase subunit I/STV1